jgi:diaminohydroxyphosphoribosylaminopyrimidine deaminase/5-amino-6-(5-phosphoribosylamino)uracil reductase
MSKELMRRALSLAAGGWGQTAPNPMVGAVVVAGDEVVGEGFHARYGGPHAEVVALEDAGARARGATIYVTLEPCAHFGKTPPCVDALIAAGITRVVIAVRDPSAIARGGVEKLRAAGIEVDIGMERDAALERNAPFFNAHASDLPWVTLKLALSADNAVADPTGTHRWITGPESRLDVHRLRAGSDAIAVGIGTVLADDPSLTVRDVPPPRIAPRRVVFDSTLRLPLDSVLVRTACDVETLAITRTEDASRAEALRDAGVTVIRAESLRAALAELRAREIRSLLVEGGPRLTGALLTASLVDRLVIFQSPLRLGPGAPQAFAHVPPESITAVSRAPVIDQRAFGDDLMTTYALHDVPCLPD